MKRELTDRQQREAARSREVLRTAVAVEEPHVVEERRGRLVASIESAIANVPAQRRTNKSRAGVRAVLAAAAVVGMSVGSWAAWHEWGGGAAKNVDVAATQTSPEIDERQVRVSFADSSGDSAPTEAASADEEAPEYRKAGDAIATDSRQVARIRFADGTRMSAGQDSALSLLMVERGSQRVRLSSGSLDVTVPRPDPRVRKVAVVTPHAEVSVKGTVFRVEVSETADDAVTQVAVKRGVVLVRHDGGTTEVTAGHSWSSSSHAEAAAKEESVATSESYPGGVESAAVSPRPTAHAAEDFSPEPSAGDDSSDRAQAGSEPSAPPPSSTLPEQNRLLERALSAEKGRDWDMALHVLNRLLADYPNSPLIDSVVVARDRVKRKKAAARGGDDG